ncbi:hypothetical protein Syun_025956 [Stephania yunnanensis]|uniref:Uncharacterized protein n=1 Tax=Stephania yunnanensis TaxID=152371 RepID=A0AAP0HW89_9MAGN
MGLGYLDVGKIIYKLIRSAITIEKNDGLPFLLMITTFYRVDQMNMAELEIDVLPEMTISDEVIERYERVNDYKDAEEERESAEIARQETKQRRKIKSNTRRILEEVSEARNDLNAEQPARDYERLYIEESELAFYGCNSTQSNGHSA